MIKQLTDFPDDVVAFVCTGRVTKADYAAVLVPAVAKALRGHKKLRLPRISPAWISAPSGKTSWSGWKASRAGSGSPLLPTSNGSNTRWASQLLYARCDETLFAAGRCAGERMDYRCQLMQQPMGLRSVWMSSPGALPPAKPGDKLVTTRASACGFGLTENPMPPHLSCRARNWHLTRTLNITTASACLGFPEATRPQSFDSSSPANPVPSMTPSNSRMAGLSWCRNWSAARQRL